MTNALIGYTGFVGSHLGDSRFQRLYNSQNIEDIRGQSLDLVVCSGIGAAKWWANLNPQEDRERIARLLACLREVEANEFILISTIDVFRDPNGKTEDDAPEPLGLHPYGLNRLWAEEWVRSHFSATRIVRLPGLFGRGLKKNVLFDLLHNHQTDLINPRGRLQWYPVSRLSHDLAAIRKAELNLCHITAQPVMTEDVRSRFFPAAKIGPVSLPIPDYDLHTNYASVLGGAGHYHFDGETVVKEISAWLQDERARIE